MDIIETLLAERARAQSLVDACDAAITAFRLVGGVAQLVRAVPAPAPSPTETVPRKRGRPPATALGAEQAILAALASGPVRLKDLAVTIGVSAPETGRVAKRMMQESQVVIEGATNETGRAAGHAGGTANGVWGEARGPPLTHARTAGAGSPDAAGRAGRG